MQAWLTITAHGQAADLQGAAAQAWGDFAGHKCVLGPEFRLQRPDS